MEERLSEEKLSRLLPALSLLAERIGAGEPLEHSALREVLLDVGINEQAWAVWGRMAIVDTKAFMLQLVRHSISGHKLPATNSPA